MKNFSRSPLFALFLLCTAWGTPVAHGFSHFGTDLTFSGAGVLSANIKSRTYLFFGSKSFALGPVVHANHFHRELQEYILGAGLQMGSTNFVIIEGGLLLRKGVGKIGKGGAGAIWIGRNISSNFRVSLPLFFRTIAEGMNKRIQFDLLPYLGLGFSF